MLYLLRRCLPITLVVLLVVLFVDGAVAQDRNSITGFVFAADRTPVDRVYVELQTELYSTVSRTQTNGSGLYSFRGLPAGRYVVKVLSSGTAYEEQSKSVSLVPLTPRGGGIVSEQVDFYLRARRQPGAVEGPAGVVFLQDVPAEAKQLYASAVEDLDQKRETEGLSKLKQSIEAFPTYYQALDRLANEYLARGHYDVSQVLFSKALEVNRRSISSGLGLAIAEYRLARLDRAISALDEVIKLDKENINALYWKGIVLHASKNLVEAVVSFRRADKLSEGKFPEVHWQLARVYKDQNKYRESADSLEVFLKLRPDAKNAEEIRQIIKTLRAKPIS